MMLESRFKTIRKLSESMAIRYAKTANRQRLAECRSSSWNETRVELSRFSPPIVPPEKTASKINANVLGVARPRGVEPLLQE